jgi:hypothetical protein
MAEREGAHHGLDPLGAFQHNLFDASANEALAVFNGGPRRELNRTNVYAAAARG